MLFVIYEFTRRGNSVLVEAIYSVWQQIMLVHAVELDFGIALWTALGYSVLCWIGLCCEAPVIMTCTFETDHPPSNSRRANKIHTRQTSRKKCQSGNSNVDFLYGGGARLLCIWQIGAQTYWTELGCGYLKNIKFGLRSSISKMFAASDIEFNRESRRSGGQS